MKPVFLFTSVIILTSLICCTGTKESRRIKRGSGIIEDSKILFAAEWENTAGFQSLTLRQNHFFTYKQSALFWWDYYAGTYLISGDTIQFSYIDGHKPPFLMDYAYIKGDTLYMPRIDERKPNQLIVKYNKHNELGYNEMHVRYHRAPI